MAILTVSDRVSAGKAKDGSGPALEEILHNFQNQNGLQVFKVVHTAIVPDEIQRIQEKVLLWTQPDAALDLILTTGGTGFSPRDVTPEAIAPLLDREAPGLVISMMMGGLSKTPLAALSRPVAGLRGSTIIITLPGSTKGASENLLALVDVLPHALELAKGNITNAPHTLATCSHGHVKQSAGVALRPRASQYTMLIVSEALNMVLDHARTVASKWAPERIRLDDPALLGGVLAESVFAAEPVPAYPASIVDGYAVRSSDGPGDYAVALSVSLAGTEELPELPEGAAARISTGAPVPRGADAVVMVEDTQLVAATSDNQRELTVRILGSVKAGANIRQIGSDLARGATVLPRGYHISPTGGALGADLGLLASSGTCEVLSRWLTKSGCCF